MRLTIRTVNGYGPRCGCGAASALHRTTRFGYVTPETSRFLCVGCLDRAIAAFVTANPKQPPYWPGDEGRDEPYAAPSGREESTDANE